MKQLQDIDFRAAYGPVPDGFSRSVQQALHQTKEEPMKKFTLRTAVMAVVTVLVLTAVAFAANEVINPTVVPTPITQFQPVDSGEDTSSTPQTETTPSAAENALYTSPIPAQPTPQPAAGNGQLFPSLIATDDSILEEHGLHIEVLNAFYNDGVIQGSFEITIPRNRIFDDEEYIYDPIFVDTYDNTRTDEHNQLTLEATCWGIDWKISTDEHGEPWWSDVYRAPCERILLSQDNEYEPTRLPMATALTASAPPANIPWPLPLRMARLLNAQIRKAIIGLKRKPRRSSGPPRFIRRPKMLRRSNPFLSPPRCSPMPLPRPPRSSEFCHSR